MAQGSLPATDTHSYFGQCHSGKLTGQAGDRKEGSKLGRENKARTWAKIGVAEQRRGQSEQEHAVSSLQASVSPSVKGVLIITVPTS